MAADRGAFICQSQSLNLFVEEANFAKLTSMHFYAWKKGLKTGMYYLRTKAAASPIQFTIDKEQARAPVSETLAAVPGDSRPKEEKIAEIACSLDNKENCITCSS